LVDVPASAAWRHLEARVGFEVVFLRREPDGYHVEGHSTAVEDGVAWGIRYAITVDPSWRTRTAHVVSLSELGTLEVRLEAEENGGWRVDGSPAPHLRGCPDVDLEASAFTNAFPVHRLGLDVGQRADAPAAYVRAPSMEVERLEQNYARLPDEGRRARYDYASPSFDYRAELVYDEFGLVVEYPGIAVRVA
jgi:uncharacterized protein